ncbi:hypothetical protein AGR2A_Cc30331 [Agrobacterium genomosp. 2 str. CFBP 5494]|uniref:Uncharacterized protein n=1 Tax=Agrobacterium genomosp. 2 str. CFBP 5494 TaxID=1183436 RepID=A0A9W5B261_9HYPH|nr:hypothetical protein AGR2A_Cc30331 [Agrobacterium genomosp. 2 str. CFBP 5494]
MSELTEERENALGVVVGDRQGLNSKLLLGLKGLQLGGFFVHFRVDEAADALVERVSQLVDEVFLQFDAHLDRAEVGGGGCHALELLVDEGNHGVERLLGRQGHGGGTNEILGDVQRGQGVGQ